MVIALYPVVIKYREQKETKMSATASSMMRINALKPSTAQVKAQPHRTSAMKRVDALQTGNSNGAFSIRFFVVLGFGGIAFAFAEFLGII